MWPFAMVGKVNEKYFLEHLNINGRIILNFEILLFT
jgi:hypothetical protein